MIWLHVLSTFWVRSVSFGPSSWQMRSEFRHLFWQKLSALPRQGFRSDDWRQRRSDDWRQRQAESCGHLQLSYGFVSWRLTTPPELPQSGRGKRRNSPRTKWLGFPGAFQQCDAPIVEVRRHAKHIAESQVPAPMDIFWCVHIHIHNTPSIWTCCVRESKHTQRYDIAHLEHRDQCFALIGKSDKQQATIPRISPGLRWVGGHRWFPSEKWLWSWTWSGQLEPQKDDRAWHQAVEGFGPMVESLWAFPKRKGPLLVPKTLILLRLVCFG